MKINPINSISNLKVTGNTNRNIINNLTDNISISFKQDVDKKPSFIDKVKTKIEKIRREKYEKSLPQNLTDKRLETIISWHGKEYLRSLETREDRERFLVLMSTDFEGKPMSGYSQTLSAYEANAVITKGIDDIQTYINLVGHDEQYKPVSGLSRILGRYETFEIMQAGVTDFQRYIDLVDTDKDGTSKAGYSRPLTVAEAITVLTEEVEDVEGFIAEQDKNK